MCLQVLLHGDGSTGGYPGFFRRQAFAWLTIIRSSRPAFLTLPVVSVALGCASAYAQNGIVNPGVTGLLLLLGVISTVAVNLYNEYMDSRSGLDFMTVRTPFSGGSGSLVEAPGLLSTVHRAAWLAGLASLLLGLLVAWATHPLFILPVLAGLFLVFSYNRLWLKRPLLALLSPGLGFGILMTGGSSYALTGNFGPLPLLLSLCSSLLVSALLLLNQFPDAAPDQLAGRRHFPMELGLQRAARLFAFLYVLVFILAGAGLVTSILPVLSGVVLLALPMVHRMCTALFRAVSGQKHSELVLSPDVMPQLLSAMQMNVFFNLGIPLALALTLVASRMLQVS